MGEKKRKNPLGKRIPRELAGDWRKYLVVALFLIIIIGFISGMYVANESMLTAAEESKTIYKLESGHFELRDEADDALLAAIETGEKADILAYYTDEAKKELDEKFADEFDETFQEEFTEEFDAEFAEAFETEFQAQFDEQFSAQVKQALLAQGLDSATAEAMLEQAVAQAKESGDYDIAYSEAKQSDDYEKAYLSAYDEAYGSAYDEAYPEAYETAYDEAWDEILEEIDEEYERAADAYELDDPDFSAIPVTLYENFYKNAQEDNDNDGVSDGTVRVYTKTTDINLACLMEGSFPTADDEIAVDRMHADNVGISVGDTVTVSGETFTVTGLIAYVNYATLHEKNTDLMFDALKFNVAMVTDGGFQRISESVHYAYAWRYRTTPADDAEQKTMSDDFMTALLTQTVVFDNEIEDYVPEYANSAVHFATDDMGSDEAMGGVLLDIFIVIIAFIFAITISNTMLKESSEIGTMRALGYTRGELVRHYLSMPVIVTFFAAAVGNILGYTVFKNVVVSMYYNSYSLPTYKTLWNPEAFVKTTVVPLILMFVVNLVVITRMLRHTPLQFLRHDLKKTKRKKAVRLPNFRFFGRFRLRIVFQNAANYVILFVGVAFVAMMLAMAVGMPDTLDYYKSDVKNMMFADYQYVLKSGEDADGNAVTTENKDAEQFAMTSLLYRAEAMDEEVSVYGVSDDSAYVDIADLEKLSGGEAYITASFADKYGLSVGDTFTLDEKYENSTYSFTVAGMFDRYYSIAIFLPLDSYRTVFGLDDGEFSGYFSDEELTDLDEDLVATVITERDVTKMADQLDHSMGSYMQYFQVACILLAAVLIYLLTKLIIEKNENAISMTKILGYENGEIASLYLFSTTIVLIACDAASVFLGTALMNFAWRKMLMTYSGWFTFHMTTEGYVKMFSFILIGYLLVLVLDFRRIQKIPMDRALKNIE